MTGAMKAEPNTLGTRWEQAGNRLGIGSEEGRDSGVIGPRTRRGSFATASDDRRVKHRHSSVRNIIESQPRAEYDRTPHVLHSTQPNPCRQDLFIMV